MDFAVLLLLLLGLGERDLEDALFDEVVVFEGAPQAAAPLLVVPAQLVVLLSLRRFLVKHIRVEERANVFVVALEALENQERRDNEEYLGLA